jgi:toxin ParE2
VSADESDPPPIVFDAAAREELVEAIAWYDQHGEKLGQDFLLEVKRAVGRMRDYPNAWAKLSARSRRCRLARFPYGVIYQPTAGEIRILAIAHLHRQPDYWKERELR